MVAIAVLTLLIALFSQVLNHATTVARIGGKHIDTDTQARAVLDRITIDIARMLKRLDVDYYIKQPINYNGHGNGHGNGHKVQTGQQGSDQIAFFTNVSGYSPSGFTASQQSPLSLVAYRVTEDSTQPSYLRLQRMAKGLLWNSVSNNSNLNNANTLVPIVFLPQTISAITRPWYAAVNNDTTTKSQDSNYETIGPNVFRFEYYYLLKNGSVTDVPWDTSTRTTQTTVSSPTPIGLTDVQSIAVAIAVIDPAGRSLVNAVSATGLYDLASDMADFKDAKGNGNPAKKIGDMEDSWNQSVVSAISTGHTSTGSAFPPAAAAAIRIYNRYIDVHWQ
jgi:hypothetical protein